MARIWIVEDDPQIGLLIELTVKKAGHEARRLVDGVELERALQKDAPELLLLDLMLREKDGFTLLREWKQRPRTKDVPVIIISARGAERDKVRGLELGAEDYVTKPFGVRELQARIQTALRRLPTEGERLEAGPLSILPKSRETFLDGRRVELTAREYELLLYLARRHLLDGQRQGYVLERRERVQQVRVLEHEAQLPVADLGQGVLAEISQLLLPQGDLPAVDGDVAGDAVEECGLARAARPHDGDELAVADLEGHAFEHLVCGLADLIGFVQVLYG